ncbi:hypothetical protein HY285_03825 [Candidatus Peregrinibacteria bacterium]|nr:hypothetical protein [Candidatus Peregrinibacteria bacterium]MBI3816645.1 hypothetical protein [Candidatus Peregrinibacteria bacterium]
MHNSAFCYPLIDMEELQSIAKGSVVYALFFPADLLVKDVQFLTQSSDDFQVGLMERPKDYEVKAHQHPPVERKLTSTSEFLYIEKGKVEVTVFDEEWKELGRSILESRCFLLFLRGGHALKMLEPTRMIEVKQGPYEGEGKVFRSS